MHSAALTDLSLPSVISFLLSFSLTHTGVERNAIIGDDAAARKRDIPIVQLNPGGVLNYKYDAECALRASGLPYTIIRCTGVCVCGDVMCVRTWPHVAQLWDVPGSPRCGTPQLTCVPKLRCFFFCFSPPVNCLAFTAAVPLPVSAGLDDRSITGPALLEADQGDTISGKVSRVEAAATVVAALARPDAAFKTFELRQSEAADAQGKEMSEAGFNRLFLKLALGECGQGQVTCGLLSLLVCGAAH
jgi:hypothetical protein